MSIFAPTRKFFTLPREPFGVGRDERVVEIPWAFSCFQGQKKVLEIGHAFATEPYLDRLKELPTNLYGVDIVDKQIEGMETTVADSRNMPFSDGMFDLIFCISTIEHVGRDNKRIYLPDDPRPIEANGDFDALKEIARVLKKGGEVVLTVPFGEFRDYGWLIQYDAERWQRLLSSVNLTKVKEDFFHYTDGWRACQSEDLSTVLYQQGTAPAAAGLACVLLRK